MSVRSYSFRFENNRKSTFGARGIGKTETPRALHRRFQLQIDENGTFCPTQTSFFSSKLYASESVGASSFTIFIMVFPAVYIIIIAVLLRNIFNQKSITLNIVSKHTLI